MSVNSQKTVLFLKDGLVLSDEEVRLIELCSKSEILILTYSEIGNKKGDVESLRRDTGLNTEYRHVKPFEPLTGLFYEENEKNGLQIDITFALPFHVMELTPFGYLERNTITIMNDNKLVQMEHRYLDYGNLQDYERESISYLESTTEGCTVKEISDKLTLKAKNKSANSFVHIPDYRKTLHRNLKSLYERGYIDKTEGKPSKYYLNANQRFMLRLTTTIRH